MLKEPMVSVIVLSYKHIKYIRKCIDSILEQETDFDFEVLIGDDASNDGTKELLSEYQKKYPDKIRLFIREQNVGAARNAYDLRKECRGKYVANMESDDYWCDPHKLQKQVDYLESHSECSAVGSNYYAMYDDGRIKCLSLMPYECNKTYCMKDFVKKYGFVIHTNTLLYRNIIPVDGEKYDKVRFCVPTMGDVFQRCLLYDKGLIYCFPEPMLCHRLTPNLASSFQSQQKNNANKYTDMMFTIVENMNEYFDNKYDFVPLVFRRIAALKVDNLMGKIKLDKKGCKKQIKRLPLKYRLKMPFKVIYLLGIKGRRVLYRKTHRKEVAYGTAE